MQPWKAALDERVAENEKAYHHEPIRATGWLIWLKVARLIIIGTIAH